MVLSRPGRHRSTHLSAGNMMVLVAGRSVACDTLHTPSLKDFGQILISLVVKRVIDPKLSQFYCCTAVRLCVTKLLIGA